MSILHRSHGNNPEVLSLGLGSLVLKAGVSHCDKEWWDVFFFLFLANHHNHWQTNEQDLVLKRIAYAYFPEERKDMRKIPEN